MLTTPTLIRPQKEGTEFSFQLNDNRSTHIGETYPQALTTINVAFASGSGSFSASNFAWVNDTVNGIFTLVIDTSGITPGTYFLQVTFKRANYANATQTVTLVVEEERIFNSGTVFRSADPCQRTINTRVAFLRCRTKLLFRRYDETIQTSPIPAKRIRGRERRRG